MNQPLTLDEAFAHSFPTVSRAPSLQDSAPNKATSYKAPKTNMSELLAVRRALTAAADVFQWARDTKGYKWEAFLTLDPSEVRDALLRHVLETGLHHDGRDPESKRLHAAHVLTNALMYYEIVSSSAAFGKPE